MSNNFASDYIDVAQRIADFRAQFPGGSLQPANPDRPYEVLTISDQTFIVYAAAAYRTPEDPRPGIGLAYEPFPGRSNFTRGSELQNAETSAWGRAIVAALAGDTKKSVASAEEVRNRQAEREVEPARSTGRARTSAKGTEGVSGDLTNAVPVDPVKSAKARIWLAAQARGMTADDVPLDFAATSNGLAMDKASVDELQSYAERLERVAA